MFLTNSICYLFPCAKQGLFLTSVGFGFYLDFFPGRVHASGQRMLGDWLSTFPQVDGKGSIKELFPTGKQLEPLVAPLADRKVAVGQDDLTVVLNEEGICTQKCALNWTDIPVAMGETNSSCSCPFWARVCATFEEWKNSFSRLWLTVSFTLSSPHN